MKSILLCVDGSAASTAATRVALGVAGDWAAKVHALYVIEDSGLASLVDDVTDGRGSAGRLVDAAEALLERVRTLAAQGAVEVECQIDQGEPFERILEHATALRPDFIVMGRTGRRGPGRALVGSEVEHVLEFTDWPVIVVPE